jgi:hypothetical protein
MEGEGWASLLRIGIGAVGLGLLFRELMPFLKRELGRGGETQPPPTEPRQLRLYRFHRGRMWCLAIAVAFAFVAVGAVLTDAPVWTIVVSFGMCVGAALGYVVLSGVLGWLEGQASKR